ncbi:MAG: sugar ABC transporter ATP-binding protein [Magnetospirillum sp.]|nr:sugar ABC transporter ATP-binding protein [Magnetospirillum sp.]
MPRVRLQVSALHKAFGTNLVLRGLDLELAAGEIHALVGGNGAGKSTLSKIIAGLETRSSGELVFDGVAYAPTSRREAQAAGVVMVLQELSVLPTLSVAENLLLGELPSRAGMLDRKRLFADAKAALVKVGLGSLDPETLAGSLGVGHQQLVEIAAGLTKECRLLVLDEPTAALSGAETKTLFELLRTLRAAGTTILYISHRLEELEVIADRVSVLRDGQMIATKAIRETTRAELIQLMAGQAIAMVSRKSTRTKGEAMLRVRDLHAGRAVRGVSFEVGAGEIVGLGGLVGAGRTELLRALFGADVRDRGEVFFGDSMQSFSPATTHESVERGIAFVPEDRKHHGILAPLAVRTNASLTRLPTRAGIPGWINGAAERSGVLGLLEKLRVRFADQEQPIAQLSGGNQQKVVIGRWLQRDVRLWLLDEPTRGVDAAARQGIYDLLHTLAEAGPAMLVASSDYEELAMLCDRVLVMSNGRITAEFTRETLTPDAFMAAAFAGFSTETRTN